MEQKEKKYTPGFFPLMAVFCIGGMFAYKFLATNPQSVMIGVIGISGMIIGGILDVVFKTYKIFGIKEDKED